ncbi:MAG: helix-turn-helix transcriptional regulator [Limnobacter sp.]|nr:helix-turn-helix transcriptional regulator [Limnobacter sp.]
MSANLQSASALAEELGERLKQARLNADYTQAEVAKLAGISRKAVLNAEKGKAQLEVFVAILEALRLTEQLDLFLPKPGISPIQLARLQGKKRQRASGRKISTTGRRAQKHTEGGPEW